MGAQPKPRSGVASLAHHDLPSRAAVMLTCAVCSLLRASCLFSRSHPPFSFPLFLSPSPLALSSVTHAKGLALASVSIATVQASIPQSGPRLRFGATPLVPCPFAFQPNLDSVCQIRFMTPHSPSCGRISETFNLEESRNFTTIILRNFFLLTTRGSY